MAVTSPKSKRFNPFSLDAINFLLADVRGALGPYLNVFLVTQQHDLQRPAGARRPNAYRRRDRRKFAPREAPSCWRSRCWLSGYSDLRAADFLAGIDR